jgi:hypothetical protein
MSHHPKRVLNKLILNYLFFWVPVIAWSQDTIPWYEGKFQYDEFGSNVTETHSHYISAYLLISNNIAIYFITDNGDIIGGKKEVLSIKSNGNTIELFYKACIAQDYVSHLSQPKEVPCPPAYTIGEKRFIFTQEGPDLNMSWSQYMIGNKFKRVSKFNFE